METKRNSASHSLPSINAGDSLTPDIEKFRDSYIMDIAEEAFIAGQSLGAETRADVAKKTIQCIAGLSTWQGTILNVSKR